MLISLPHVADVTELPSGMEAVPEALTLHAESQSTWIQLLLPLLSFYLINHSLISS